MMTPKTSLSWSMQVMLSCKVGQAGVDDRHKQFGKGGGDGNTTIVIHINRVPFTLIQRHHLGISPRLRWLGVDGNCIKKLSKTLNARSTHVFQHLQWHGAPTR